MPEDRLPFAIYLTFNGNCRQAFSYYQSCFGGDLTVQTMADTPYGKQFDLRTRNTVICATLQNNYCRLIGTDLASDEGIITGNNISILIECNSIAERAALFNRLAGRSFCTAAHTSTMICITDRYRIKWMLQVNTLY